MSTTYDEAIDIYNQAMIDEYGHCETIGWPSEQYSDVDKNGRWILRNMFYTIGYVTSRGKVLDAHFQQIGGMQ